MKVVYLWVDGVYVKAGLEKEKAAVLAALSDGRKVEVSAAPGHRESTNSWSEALRDLRDRGMNCPKVVGDGHLASGVHCAPSTQRQRSSAAGTTRS